MINQKFKNFKTILEEERNNFEATVNRYPEEMKYFDKLLYLYEKLFSHLASYPENLVPILQMYWNCFRGFLISTQLMFQTHIPEAYTIISRSAEAVASARKMFINPEKLPEWIKAEKENSKPFRRILGKLFSEEDKLVYPEIFEIYKLTSNYGRHPNFESTIFFSKLHRIKSENMIYFNYCDIDDESILWRCLNYQIYAYLKFLSVFKEIFKKYIVKEWIKEYEKFEKEYKIYKESLKIKFQSR